MTELRGLENTPAWNGIMKTPTQKTPTWKNLPIKLPRWIPTQKISTQKAPIWNIPTHVFKYLNTGFFIFFVFFIIVTVIIDITFL